MDSNDNNNSLLSEAKKEFDRKSKSLAKTMIDALFDYLEDYMTETIKDSDKRATFLNTLRIVFTKPETEEKVSMVWAESLYEKGLIPLEFRHHSDDLLVHDLQQRAYMAGRTIGYFQALTSLMENDAPKEAIIAVEDFFSKNLSAQSIGGRYECADEAYQKFDEVKCAWKQRNGIQT